MHTESRNLVWVWGWVKTGRKKLVIFPGFFSLYLLPGGGSVTVAVGASDR